MEFQSLRPAPGRREVESGRHGEQVHRRDTGPERHVHARLARRPGRHPRTDDHLDGASGELTEYAGFSPTSGVFSPTSAGIPITFVARSCASEFHSRARATATLRPRRSAALPPHAAVTERGPPARVPATIPRCRGSPRGFGPGRTCTRSSSRSRSRSA